jgi:glycosyltransferase involved in cell wall biosynthesis
MLIDVARGRPKILFVTSHWPLAPAYGAQQRVLNIGSLLSRIGDVSFVIAATEPEDDETVRRTKREFDVRRIIHPVPVTTRRSIDYLCHRFRHELDPTYMATDPYIVTDRDRDGLERLIFEYDLVWVHTIRTANWFRIYRWSGSVLDVDDLPSRWFWSEVQSGTSSAERLLDLRRTGIWWMREHLFRKRFDVITVCSEDDRRYLGGHQRIHVIPNGFHPLAVYRRPSLELPRVGFIGNCGFGPNADGIIWFIRHVWPIIKREFPSVQLRLVGRETDGYLPKLGPDIQGLGWLDDPSDEIDSWSAMIVPIKVGSGTRVKAAEAFARRCPVVATTIGVFGYEVDSGVDMLLADRVDDFASACILLLRNPQLGEALAEKVHKRFLERWTWNSFESTVGTVVQESLARSNRLQRAPARAKR